MRNNNGSPDGNLRCSQVIGSLDKRVVQIIHNPYDGDHHEEHAGIYQSHNHGDVIVEHLNRLLE
ncbi:hypothetical protein SDC9_167976 [bioreactor metagenome]|uniref:Uncharacterized protein n=1 Tax=bioreactor metagenome TaxID=1076179 RepID=A0A645G179_9ZZZZ